MGFCILFPQLCGLRTAEIAEMKMIVMDISDDLDAYLHNPSITDIQERENAIAECRTRARQRLEEKGYVI